MPFLARLPASIQIKLSPRLCSWLSMLLLPAFPIATTQMNAPTPTEMPRIVRTLLTQLRLSAALASRIVFLRFMLSDVGNPISIHRTRPSVQRRFRQPGCDQKCAIHDEFLGLTSRNSLKTCALTNPQCEKCERWGERLSPGLRLFIHEICDGCTGPLGCVATSPGGIASATGNHRPPEAGRSRAPPSASCSHPRLADSPALPASSRRISSRLPELPESSDS